MTAHRTLLTCTLCLILVSPGLAMAQAWEGAAAFGIRVTDEHGDAIEGASVLVRVSDTETDGPPAVQTDASGRAVISGLRDGEWFVEVSHASYMIYSAYLSLKADKKPIVGFSSQVNTQTSWSPMTVKFQKATGDFRRAASKRRSQRPRAAPEVVREAPAQEPGTVRTEPEPPTVVRPEAPLEMAEPEAPDSGATKPPRAEPEVTAEEAPVIEMPDAETPISEAPAPESVPAPTEVRKAEEPQTEPESLSLATDELVSQPSEPNLPPETRRPEGPGVSEAPSVSEAASEPLPTESQASLDDAPPTTPAVETGTPVRPPTQPAAPEPAVAEAASEADTTPTAAAPGIESPASRTESQSPPAPPVATPTPEPPPALDTQPGEPAVTDVPPSGSESPPVELTEETEALEPVEPEVAPEAAAVAIERARTPEPETAAPAAPGTVAPATAARLPRFLRSASAGNCTECEPGEWAVAAEQEAARASDVRTQSECTEAWIQQARDAASLLADAPADRLNNYSGPVLTAMFRLEPDSRDPVQDRLAVVTDPESNCQMAGVVLPAGASFSGYVLEAWDSLGGRGCRAGLDCAVGRARWLDEPEVVAGRERTVVFSIFKNRSSRRERRLRMTIYFSPADPDWVPRTR